MFWGHKCVCALLGICIPHIFPQQIHVSSLTAFTQLCLEVCFAVMGIDMIKIQNNGIRNMGQSEELQETVAFTERGFVYWTRC